MQALRGESLLIAVDFVQEIDDCPDPNPTVRGAWHKYLMPEAITRLCAYIDILTGGYSVFPRSGNECPPPVSFRRSSPIGLAGLVNDDSLCVTRGSWGGLAAGWRYWRPYRRYWRPYNWGCQITIIRQTGPYPSRLSSVVDTIPVSGGVLARYPVHSSYFRLADNVVIRTRPAADVRRSVDCDCVRLRRSGRPSRGCRSTCGCRSSRRRWFWRFLQGRQPTLYSVHPPCESGQALSQSLQGKIPLGHCYCRSDAKQIECNGNDYKPDFAGHFLLRCWLESHSVVSLVACTFLGRENAGPGRTPPIRR